MAILIALVLDVTQGRMYTLPDVWIRPSFGGKGRKVTGQLEAHSNGFRYSSPKGETLDIMYRCVRPAGILLAAHLQLLVLPHPLTGSRASWGCHVCTRHVT